MLAQGVRGHQMLCTRPSGQVLAEAHRAMQNKTEEDFYGPCPDPTYTRFCAVPGWVSKGRRVKPIAAPATAKRILKSVGADLCCLNDGIDDFFAHSRNTFSGATQSWDDWNYAGTVSKHKRQELLAHWQNVERKEAVEEYWNAWDAATRRGEVYVSGTAPSDWDTTKPLPPDIRAAAQAEQDALAGDAAPAPALAPARAPAPPAPHAPPRRNATRLAGGKRARDYAELSDEDEDSQTGRLGEGEGEGDEEDEDSEHEHELGAAAAHAAHAHAHVIDLTDD